MTLESWEILQRKDDEEIQDVCVVLARYQHEEMMPGRFPYLSLRAGEETRARDASM